MSDISTEVKQVVEDATTNRDLQKNNPSPTMITLRCLQEEHERITRAIDSEQMGRDEYMALISALEDCVKEIDDRINESIKSLDVVNTALLSLDSSRRKPTPRKKPATPRKKDTKPQ